MKRLPKNRILALCAALMVVNAAQGEDSTYSPIRYDIQQRRVCLWDEDYRQRRIETPAEIPAFLIPVRESFYKKLEEFCARHEEYAEPLKNEVLDTSLIEEAVKVLARYYYLQVQLGEYCYGAENAVALEKYRAAVEQDILRLSLELLRSCYWCSANTPDYSESETPDDLYKQLSALPVYADYGYQSVLEEYLQSLNPPTDAPLDDMQVLELNTLYSLRDDMRCSRLYDLANTAAVLHFIMERNTLTGGCWDSQGQGKVAATHIVQQFDTWREIMHLAHERGLCLPRCLTSWAGIAYMPEVGFFLANQEAVLRRVLNDYSQVAPEN